MPSVTPIRHKPLNQTVPSNCKLPTIKIEADNAMITEPTETSNKCNGYFFTCY